MNIKNDETHALARELAALENTTVTDAVARALREALEHRVRQQDSRIDRATATLERMRRRLADSAGPSLHVINQRLYDEHGLPQ